MSAVEAKVLYEPGPSGAMVARSVRARVLAVTYSRSNQRGHWAKHSARIAAERLIAGSAMWTIIRSASALDAPLLPCIVQLTRFGRQLLDDDNLRPCLKAWRDGIADRLRVADNDPRISWEYAQEKVRTLKECAVEIEWSPRA